MTVSKGSRRELLTAAVASGIAILAVLLFGLWLRLHGAEPTPLDLWWYELVGLDGAARVLPVALALHVIGSTRGVAICILVGVVALLAFRRRRDAGALVLAGLLGLVCSEGLKLLVARPRPVDALVVEHSFSYPSGHSMGAAMLAVSLALVFASGQRSPLPTRTWVWGAVALWTLAVMWSRAAVQVHWLTDTLAGAALGAAVAILARFALAPGAAPVITRGGDG